MTQNQSKKTYKLSANIYIVSILLLIVILVIIPELSIKTFFNGILLWATKILPALLPFFILTKLLSYTSFTTTIGKFLSPITKKFFGVGGISGYVYIMSILSGYPLGAKLTSDLYQAKQITSKQAKTICSFTSTSGPLFILGTVGIGFFESKELGIIVLASHFLSAILNGLIYKNKEKKDNNVCLTNNIPDNFLNDAMTNSITSVMIVGGFIALFYMILSIANYLNLFKLPIFLLSKVGINANISNAILSGIVEVTTGISLLSRSNISFKLSCIITSFLVSFGGISIHAQAFCFMKNFEMKYKTFFIQKVTHAIISASVTWLILLIF